MTRGRREPILRNQDPHTVQTTLFTYNAQPSLTNRRNDETPNSTLLDPCKTHATKFLKHRSSTTGLQQSVLVQNIRHVLMYLSDPGPKPVVSPLSTMGFIKLFQIYS